MTESTTGTSVATETGNEVTGIYTLTQTPSDAYTLSASGTAKAFSMTA